MYYYLIRGTHLHRIPANKQMSTWHSSIMVISMRLECLQHMHFLINTESSRINDVAA